MGLEKIDNMIDRLKGFTSVLRDELHRVVMEHEDIIVKMITDDQLYHRGINGMDVEIASYKPYTVNTRFYKALSNQPTDRVTLRDTGAFHSSVYVDILGNGDFLITAADSKVDALIKKYGVEILALTDENLEKLVNTYVRPDLIIYMKKYIWNGK